MTQCRLTLLNALSYGAMRSEVFDHGKLLASNCMCSCLALLLLEELELM